MITPAEPARPLLPLIARAADQATFAAALERTAAGHGQLVVVEGEAGIGKSRLVEEALVEARAADFTVLIGFADEIERRRPFAAVIDAFGLSRTAADPERARIAELVVADGPRPGEPDSPGRVEYRVCEAIEVLVERLAAQRPTAVVIEDVHWSDPATLTCLAGLGRISAQLPLLVVLTARPVPRSTELEALLAGFDRRGAHRLRLAPLTDQDIPALTEAAVGLPPGPNLRELLGRAGGNPLLLLELLTVLSDDQSLLRTAASADIDRQRISTVPGLTVLHRLSHLSGAAREVLRTASLLGTAFDVADLCLLTGRPAVALAPALAEARAAGALTERGERLAFRHELVRDALYADLPASLRQAMHRDFATALADAGGAPERIGEHLMRGARPGDQEAARWLRDAARSVATRAPTVAIDLLDHALTLVDTATPLYGPLAADRALALMAAGRAEAGERACHEVLDRRLDVEREALLRRMLIRSMMFTGRPAETLPVLERAMAMSGTTGRERAGFRGAAAYLQIHLGDHRRALDLAEEAVTIGRESRDSFALSEALNAKAQALGFAGRVAEAADAGLAALSILGAEIPPIGAQSTASTAGLMLLAAGRVREGKEVLRRGREINEEIGAPTGVALQHVNLADGLYLSGEWDDAVAEVEATVGLTGDRPALPASTEPLLSIIAVHRNDLAAARMHLDAADAATRAGGSSTRRHRRDLAAALLADAHGQRGAALTTLTTLWTQLVAGGMGFGHPEVGPETVRRLVAEDRNDEAGQVADQVERCAAENPGVASIRGAALLCRGLATGDMTTVLDAVAAYRSGSRPYDLAVACEDAAALLAGAERRADAIDLLREAGRTYEALLATRCLARVTARLRELGVRSGAAGRRSADRSGWGALTPSERAVVALVAERLSNGEIAARLFLSRRTVESHVSHALAKTGSRSRLELAADAVGRDLRSGSV